MQKTVTIDGKTYPVGRLEPELRGLDPLAVEAGWLLKRADPERYERMRKRRTLPKHLKQVGENGLDLFETMLDRGVDHLSIREALNEAMRPMPRTNAPGETSSSTPA